MAAQTRTMRRTTKKIMNEMMKETTQKEMANGHHQNSEDLKP